MVCADGTDESLIGARLWNNLLLAHDDGRLRDLLKGAAVAGHAGCALGLLSCSAALDPNVQLDEYGSTALLLACAGGHVSCVRALLEAGADPAYARHADGMSAILVAAQQGDVATCRELVEAGLRVEPDDTTWMGRMTPMSLACSYGHVAIVRLLLEYKADVNHSVLVLDDDDEVPRMKGALDEAAEGQPRATDACAAAPMPPPPPSQRPLAALAESEPDTKLDDAPTEPCLKRAKTCEHVTQVDNVLGTAGELQPNRAFGASLSLATAVAQAARERPPPEAEAQAPLTNESSCRRLEHVVLEEANIQNLLRNADLRAGCLGSGGRLPRRAARARAVRRRRADGLHDCAR